jgi:hypothetical protein
MKSLYKEFKEKKYQILVWESIGNKKEYFDAVNLFYNSPLNTFLKFDRSMKDKIE